jgi:hypothetical protein
MPKPVAILGSALFFVVAPTPVAGLIPCWITRWELRPPFLELEATCAVGSVLILAGAPGLVGQSHRLSAGESSQHRRGI